LRTGPPDFLITVIGWLMNNPEGPAEAGHYVRQK
jgi:hypothetical protein